MEVLFSKQRGNYGDRRSDFIDNYRSSTNYNETMFSSTHEEGGGGDERQAGEHTTTYLRQARAKYEPVELVVDRPTILPSVATVIADIQAPTRVTSIRPSKVVLPEDSSVQFDMEVNDTYRSERFDEMELVLERPIVRDSSTTLLANIQAGLELKSILPSQQPMRTIEDSTSSFTMQYASGFDRQDDDEEEVVELRLRKPYIQDSSSVLLAEVQSDLRIQGPLKPSPYLARPIEESSTALTMELNSNPAVAPFELIIPRLERQPSSSTILAQVSPTLAGQRARVNIPEVERSTSSFFMEQQTRHDEEVELIMPKPRHIEKSSSTMMADVQARLETTDIRASQIHPEQSTTTFYFDEAVPHIVPQPVEMRLKQPIVADSSTTLFANVKPAFDTEQVQQLGHRSRSLETSSSALLIERQPERDHPSQVELILPRPHVQESTSVLLADVRATLDTSQRHLVIPPPLPISVKSTSEFILDQDILDDERPRHDEIYVLGSSHHQEQQYGYRVTEGSPVVHVDMDKPVELVFNVGEGSLGSTSFNQQQRREYSSRMMNTNASTVDSSSTLYSGKHLVNGHSPRHLSTFRNATTATASADRVSCLGRSWRYEYLCGSILKC